MGDIMPSLVIPPQGRMETGSVNVLPADLSPTSFPESINPGQVAADLVALFQKALAAKDYQGLAKLFLDDGHWKDHLCLTWDLRSLQGPAKISEFLSSHGSRLESISLDTSSSHRAPIIAPLDGFGKSKCVAFFIKVTTAFGAGQGIVRLVWKDCAWKVFGFYTALVDLKGFEEPRGRRRPMGVEHSGNRGMKNWQEKRVEDANFESSEPKVVIIGAGQAGLTCAARLKMLNVDTLVIDREDRIGDSWRKRYRQLVLHDPVWFDHLPYLNFPDYWPIFTPKDKIAEFFESYVKILELNVWTQTNLVSSSWDDVKKEWTVTVERQVGDVKETRTFHPHHVVLATGHSGQKNFPTIKGMDDFKGLLCHSSEFPGAKPNSKGKRAIVVGSCNSGHDIAQDFYENGYDVTMVQRSSTCVVSSKAITDMMLAPLYAEGGPPVEDADLILWSFPRAVHKKMQIEATSLANEHDSKTLEGLLKAGFKLDNGPDSAGLFYKYFQRGGGYYIDVGCSQLIIDGHIKVKQGQEIAEVQPDGLLFADGVKLLADEVVFATGYQNMRTQARIILGDYVAEKARDVWGFDEEGEWRTMWRRSGHPGFWFMGGNLALCRYYGKFLALQIKALEEGLASYDSV